MALARKTMGVLVDSGLYLGLIVALWGVYSVETRLPRRRSRRPWMAMSRTSRSRKACPVPRKS